MDTICRLEQLCVTEVQKDPENSYTFTCFLCLLLSSLKNNLTRVPTSTHAHVHTQTNTNASIYIQLKIQHSHLTSLTQLLYGGCWEGSALDKNPFCLETRESQVTSKICFLNSYYVSGSGLGTVTLEIHQAALEGFNITEPESNTHKQYTVMSRHSSNSDGSPYQAIYIIHRVLHSKTQIIPLFPRT